MFENQSLNKHVMGNLFQEPTGQAYNYANHTLSRWGAETSSA
jgi:hypothetical protein